MTEEIKTLEIKAKFDGDTKRTDRFLFQQDGISGSVYIQKDSQVPDEIILKLMSE